MNTIDKYLHETHLNLSSGYFCEKVHIACLPLLSSYNFYMAQSE